MQRGHEERRRRGSHGHFFEREARRPSPNSTRRRFLLLRSFPTFTLQGLGSSGQVGPVAGGPRQRLSPAGWALPAASGSSRRAGSRVGHRSDRGKDARAPPGAASPGSSQAPAAGPRAAPRRRPSPGASHHRAAASALPRGGPDRGHGVSRAGSIPSPRPGGLQPLRTPRRYGFTKRERGLWCAAAVV